MRLRFCRFGLIFGLAYLTALGCAMPQQSLVDSLPTYHGTKKIVAVLEFGNATDYGADQFGRLASDMMIAALSRSERFLLVERDRLNQVLKEQALGRTGALDPGTCAKVGQILGAQYLIMGTVSEFAFRERGKKNPAEGVTDSAAEVARDREKGQDQLKDPIYSRKVDIQTMIDVRAVEVKTGRVLWADRAEGGGKNVRVEFRSASDQAGGGGAIYDETTARKTLRRAIDRSVYDLALVVKDKPWESKIARIGDDKIYMVGGRDVGARLKSDVNILRIEPRGTDPTTGEALEMREETIGRGEIVRVEEHYSVVHIEEGGGFSFDDLVRTVDK